MTTAESIQFHHGLARIIEGGKAKGIEKSAAKRLASDATAKEFEEAYLEARRAQRRATRTIRLVDYDGDKKVKKLSRKQEKERDEAMAERRETQQTFVAVHKALKKFLQGRIEIAKGVAAIKKALGVKVSAKVFAALAALWAKYTGFKPKATDESDDDKPARRTSRKPARRSRKDESDDDESDDESDDSDDDKPAKRKLAKKGDKKSKKLARVKPTKKRVVEDDDEDLDSDDESDDESD